MHACVDVGICMHMHEWHAYSICWGSQAPGPYHEGDREPWTPGRIYTYSRLETTISNIYTIYNEAVMVFFFYHNQMHLGEWPRPFNMVTF